MPFTDRRDAGRQLARLAAPYRGDDALVLGLPRGGVPVAFEVASALGAPLDVMVARKLGAPGQPELAVGAVAPGGVRVLDERALRAMGVTHAELDQVVADETEEMQRRLLVYRGEPTPPDVRGRTVLLVDDGLATGATARAAVRSLRRQEPRTIVVLVPVAAPESAASLAQEADAVLAVETPEDFRAVGLWYDDFRQTSDEEVLELLRLAGRQGDEGEARSVEIPHGGLTLRADLTLPRNAKGIVVFAHGSGSGRASPRNRQVARRLNEKGFATLLLDLLTEEEERVDQWTRHLRFDVPLLAERLVEAVGWAARYPAGRGLGIGLFGASTGAAAALVAAARHPDLVQAVVSRGGRPDLAGDALPRVEAPTLLVVGGHDARVADLNRDAMARMRHRPRLEIVPGASHLFEEPGTLDEAARLAARWFNEHLGAPRAHRADARLEEGRRP